MIRLSIDREASKGHPLSETGQAILEAIAATGDIMTTPWEVKLTMMRISVGTADGIIITEAVTNAAEADRLTDQVGRRLVTKSLRCHLDPDRGRLLETGSMTADGHTTEAIRVVESTSLQM